MILSHAPQAPARNLDAVLDRVASQRTNAVARQSVGPDGMPSALQF